MRSQTHNIIVMSIHVLASIPKQENLLKISKNNGFIYTSIHLLHDGDGSGDMEIYFPKRNNNSWGKSDFFLGVGGGIEIQESLKTNNTFHIIIFLTMGWNK